MTQNLNHYEKILSRSHSNYLAQISIEMTDANNQINDILSKLTALGTVLIPMNLVTGTEPFTFIVSALAAYNL
jgi:magnesium transporter